MTEKEFDKFFSSLAKMMREQIEAQNEYSKTTASHIDRLIKLQEESAARFFQTNDMVKALIDIANEQRVINIGLTDRLDRMTTLHTEQAHEIQKLVEENRKLMGEMLSMQLKFSTSLMELIEKINCRPMTNNIIQ